MDGLSVASSIFSVVSLGLTVCQGLATYTTDLKSFNEETENISLKIKGLQNVLNALSDLQSSYEALNSSSASALVLKMISYVNQSLLVCQNDLAKLKRALDDVTSNDSSGKARAARNYLNKILYPLRRHGLVGRAEAIGRLQENLNTILLLLKIALDQDSHEKMGSIEAAVQSISLNTTQMTTRLIEIKSRQDEIFDQQNNMISKILDCRLQPALEPSAIQSLQEDFQQNERDMKISMRGIQDVDSVMINAQDRFRSARTVCWCSYHTLHPFASPNVFSSYELVHRKGCPLHIPGQRIKIWQLKYTFCNIFLRRSIWASWQWTVGSGPHRIDRNLVFHTVVDGSPAFKLLEGAYCTGCAMAGRFNIWEIYKTLLCLFRNKQAFPTDLDYQGRNFLVWLVQIVELLLSLPEGGHIVQTEILDSLLRILEDLNRQGLLLNWPDNSGINPLDRLVLNQFNDLEVHAMYTRHRDTTTTARDYPFELTPRQLKVLKIISIFLEAGHFVTSIGLGWGDERIRFNALITRKAKLTSSLFPVEDILVPRALEPLLTRDQQQLEMTIGEKVDMYWAFNSYVEWPEAIDYLLDAGVEPNEYSFRQAVVQGQIQTLKRILAKRKNYRICQCFLEAASARAPACSFENLEVFEFLANLVSKRRKELQSIAEATLPKDVLSHLRIRPDTLIGYAAGETVQLLSSHGVDVEFEGGNGYLIYNQVHGRTAFAEDLWNVGFKDVDETDSEGYTCLMLTPAIPTAARLEFAYWLKEKGADLDHRRMDQPAMFYVAYGTGQLLMHHAVCYRRAHQPSHVFPDSESSESQSWGMVKDILSRSYRDLCTCKCSDAGCCSTTRFVHGLAFNKLPQEQRMKVTSNFGDIGTQHSVTANASALIRALTFDTLSLPHTCNHSTDSEDEILAHIPQNETKGSIQLLDDLMNEFHQMYDGSDSTLLEFLQGDWATRMGEVCGEKVVIDEDNAEEFVDALEQVTP